MRKKTSKDMIPGLTLFYPYVEHMLDYFQQTPVPTIILDSNNSLVLVNNAMRFVSDYPDDAVIVPAAVLDIPDMDLSAPGTREPGRHTELPADAGSVRGSIVTAGDERLPARFSVGTVEAGRRRTLRIIQVLEILDGDNQSMHIQGSAAKELFPDREGSATCGDPEYTLASIINKSIDGFVLVDSCGHITIWNPGMEKITGLSRSEMEGRYVWDVLADYVPSLGPFTGRREGLREMTEDAIRTGRSSWFKRVIELPIMPHDNSERIIQLITFPIDCDRDNMIASIVRDVTGLKELEEERRKADKLESLNILTGGLAHDFNDILTSIIGNISLAKTYVKDGEELFSMLGDAEIAALKAQNLTKRILDLSKVGTPLKQRTEITRLVQETTEYCLTSSNLECAYSLPDDTWNVDVDPDLIGQVISHIVQNANRAMPEGGVILVKAENVVIDKTDGIPVKPGPYVKIDIEDRGQSIPADRLPDIFDPHTGEADERYGIGLAASYSIVKHHGGHIAVDTHTGAGTTFTVYLPAYPEKQEPKTHREYSEFTGKVLVMDDDVLVRTVISRMLEKLGAHVDESADGEEAVRKFIQARERGGGYDVVILDLVVPHGLGGVETLQRLRDIDPDVRAVVSSGYTGDPVMLNYKAYGFRYVIRKPYQLSDLAQALVRAVSDG